MLIKNVKIARSGDLLFERDDKIVTVHRTDGQLRRLGRLLVGKPIVSEHVGSEPVGSVRSVKFERLDGVTWAVADLELTPAGVASASEHPYMSASYRCDVVDGRQKVVDAINLALCASARSGPLCRVDAYKLTEADEAIRKAPAPRVTPKHVHKSEALKMKVVIVNGQLHVVRADRATSRLDMAELGKPIQVGESTHYQARVASTAPLFYADPDGGSHTETRDHSEIDNIVRQLPGRPVTLDHPPDMFSNGSTYPIGGHVVRAWKDTDDNGVAFACAELEIDDPDLLSAIRSGTHELSLGYVVDLIDGVRQVGTVVDHVACVINGRCGPSCSLRVDRADKTRVKRADKPKSCHCGGACRACRKQSKFQKRDHKPMPKPQKKPTKHRVDREDPAFDEDLANQRMVSRSWNIDGVDPDGVSREGPPADPVDPDDLDHREAKHLNWAKESEKEPGGPGPYEDACDCGAGRGGEHDDDCAVNHQDDDEDEDPDDPDDEDEDDRDDEDAPPPKSPPGPGSARKRSRPVTPPASPSAPDPNTAPQELVLNDDRKDSFEDESFEHACRLREKWDEACYGTDTPRHDSSERPRTVDIGDEDVAYDNFRIRSSEAWAADDE